LHLPSAIISKEVSPMLRRSLPQHPAMLALIALTAGYIIVLAAAWAPVWDHVIPANKDFRHPWLTWSQTGQAAVPWGDPVLTDPDTTIPRLALIIPNSFLFVVRRVLDPRATWLFAVFFGFAASILAARWLFRVDGASSNVATFGGMAFVVFRGILSQFPPLTFNQLRYVLDELLLTSDSRPLFYSYSVTYFIEPYFVFSAALTLYVLSNTMAQHTARQRLLVTVLWCVVAAFQPLVYFWHWLLFAGLIPVLCAAMVWSGRASRDRVRRFMLGPFLIVAAVWVVYYIVQSAITASAAGQDYLLTVGYREGRFTQLEAGVIIRAVLLAAASIFLLARTPLKKSAALVIGPAIYVESLLLGNMQLLMGRTVQAEHFNSLNTVGVTLFWLTVMIYGWQWLSNRFVTLTASRLRYSVLVAGCVVMIAYNSAFQMREWQRVIGEANVESETLELLAFFRDHAEIEVILTDDIVLESDILFMLGRRSYLPWGGLSSIHPIERMQRAHDAWQLLYSADSDTSFALWLGTQEFHLFHMKYLKSTTAYDPETADEARAYRESDVFPEPERAFYNEIDTGSTIHYRLDAIIYRADQPVPGCLMPDALLFTNAAYVVYAAPSSCE
jgi:hypothetical protein